MTLATSSKRGKTPMSESSVSAGGFDGGKGAPFLSANSPMQNVGKTRTISAKMGESLFIVEYDGSVPLNLPADWPFPSYEVRRKLPMKECMRCRSELLFYEGNTRKPQARRTSWVFRKRGEFYWHRVCFEHMTPEMRKVIAEMYSR